MSDQTLSTQGIHTNTPLIQMLQILAQANGNGVTVSPRAIKKSTNLAYLQRESMITLDYKARLAKITDAGVTYLAWAA